MQESKIRTAAKLPYCPGCGHGITTKAIGKALKNAGYNLLDVVAVSDIGCCGLVDPLLATHTVHGLHGRSPALGMGVTFGLADTSKKIIVIQGDGGATIGLQHIMEAARRNADMTLILQNNLLYGMTGGQMSGLSTNEFKVERHIDDDTPPFNICELAHTAGAAYCARVNSPANIEKILETAFSIHGFSLVEISSLCPSYGANKLEELYGFTEEDIVLTNTHEHKPNVPRKTKPLFAIGEGDEKVMKIDHVQKTGIVLSGSAGGGVQSASKLLANAGILCGLSTTMKGEYPITVGTGFSAAEVILSGEEINYSGLEIPDIFIIVSEEGYNKVADRLHPGAKIVMDSSLDTSSYPDAIVGDFQKIGGKKGAILCAVAAGLSAFNILPQEALIAAVNKHKYATILLESINKTEDCLASAQKNAV